MRDSRLACYLSDDGASMLMFDCLAEAAGFARIWVPFCKRHNIEPRSPEAYFAHTIDFLKDKVQPDFVKARRRVKVRDRQGPLASVLLVSSCTTPLISLYCGAEASGHCLLALVAEGVRGVQGSDQCPLCREPPHARRGLDNGGWEPLAWVSSLIRHF